MFLQNLTDQQKLAFLFLADRVVQADGQLTPEETSLLDTFRAEMGLTGAPVPTMGLSAALDAFDSRPARVSAFLELIALAHADLDFDQAESAVIDEVRQAFGLSPADAEVMLNWVLRQMALVREASALMTMGA